MMIVTHLAHIYRRRAQCPVVDNLGSKWRVYYANRDEKGQSFISFFDMDANEPYKITYDHRAPIMPLGKPGTFDEHGMMPTWVGMVGDRKLLYYVGWQRQASVPYRNSIGVAEVRGVYVKKLFEGPVLGVSREDPYFTGTMWMEPNGPGFDAYYLSSI